MDVTFFLEYRSHYGLFSNLDGIELRFAFLWNVVKPSLWAIGLHGHWWASLRVCKGPFFERHRRKQAAQNMCCASIAEDTWSCTNICCSWCNLMWYSLGGPWWRPSCPSATGTKRTDGGASCTRSSDGCALRFLCRFCFEIGAIFTRGSITNEDSCRGGIAPAP